MWEHAERAWIEQMQKEPKSFKATITLMSSIKQEPHVYLQNTSSTLSWIQEFQNFIAIVIPTGEANYKTRVRSIRNTLGQDLIQYISTSIFPKSFNESYLASLEDYTI